MFLCLTYLWHFYHGNIKLSLFAFISFIGVVGWHYGTCIKLDANGQVVFGIIGTKLYYSLDTCVDVVATGRGIEEQFTAQLKGRTDFSVFEPGRLLEPWYLEPLEVLEQ